MKIEKKILLILGCAFLLLAGLFFLKSNKFISKKEMLSEVHVVESNSTAAQVAKPELKKPELEANVSHEVKKIQTAIKYFKKENRKPANHLVVAVDQLVSSEVMPSPRWKLWSSVRAVQIENTLLADEIILRMNNLNIIHADISSNLSEFNKDAQAVVYDSRLKKIGLITGFIKIETNRKDLLEKSLKPLDAEIINSFDKIETYFITSRKAIFDLENLYQLLKVQSFIKSIEIDISDRDYEKQ